MRSVTVRANEGAVEAKPASFSAPTLNPDTPSPIFGGSTGGLLRKAQVRAQRCVAVLLRPALGPGLACRRRGSSAVGDLWRPPRPWGALPACGGGRRR